MAIAEKSVFRQVVEAAREVKRLPQKAAGAFLWEIANNHLIRAEVSGQENLEEVKRHFENGGSVMVVADHVDQFDPGKVMQSVYKHLPLDHAYAFISQRQLDNFPNGPVMKATSAYKKFQPVGIIQRLKRDREYYETLLLGIKEGLSRKEAKILAKEKVKGINKHEPISTNQKYPLSESRNSAQMGTVARELRTGGIVVFLWPEGHRSETGGLLKAEDGAGDLLRLGRAKTLVLPISLEHDNVSFLKGKLKMVIGKAFNYADVENQMQQRQTFGYDLSLADHIMLRLKDPLPLKDHGVYGRFF